MVGITPNTKQPLSQGLDVHLSPHWQAAAERLERSPFDMLTPGIIYETAVLLLPIRTVRHPSELQNSQSSKLP